MEKGTEGIFICNCHSCNTAACVCACEELKLTERCADRARDMGGDGFDSGDISGAGRERGKKTSRRERERERERGEIPHSQTSRAPQITPAFCSLLSLSLPLGLHFSVRPSFLVVRPIENRERADCVLRKSQTPSLSSLSPLSPLSFSAEMSPFPPSLS